MDEEFDDVFSTSDVYGRSGTSGAGAGAGGASGAGGAGGIDEFDDYEHGEGEEIAVDDMEAEGDMEAEEAEGGDDMEAEAEDAEDDLEEADGDEDDAEADGAEEEDDLEVADYSDDDMHDPARSAFGEEVETTLTLSDFAGGVGMDAMDERRLEKAFNLMYDELITHAPRKPYQYGRFALEVFMDAVESMGGQPIRMEDMNLTRLRLSYEHKASGINHLVSAMRRKGMLNDADASGAGNFGSSPGDAVMGLLTPRNGSAGNHNSVVPPPHPTSTMAANHASVVPFEGHVLSGEVLTARGTGGSASGGNASAAGSQQRPANARLSPKELRGKIWHLRLFLGQLFSAAAAVLGCGVRRANPSSAFEMGTDDCAKYPFLNSGESQAKTIRRDAKLIYFFLGQAYSQGFRREGGTVYRQRFVSGGHASHAWMPAFTMSEFLHRMCRKEIHAEIWDLLHGDGSRASTIEQYLARCADPEFPEIRRQRRYHSFLNGVYDVEADSFVGYGSAALTEDVVSCNLHELEMDRDWFADARFSDDPCGIPTPYLDRILQEQDIPPGGEVYQWVLAWVLGRTLYDMGTVEKHHRNGVLLLGHAGSGKSTLAKIVQAYYAAEDTGQLNSECEPKFALAALAGKKVWFCTEVKKNFQLDVGMLLQMLEGARMAIQEKHKTARDEDWRIPGIMAGNELPTKWIEGGAGNSLVRRMMIVSFPNKPKRLDPNLESNIMSELAAIMVKSNRLYRKVAAQIARTNGGDIDTSLPQYFKNTLATFQARTQPFLYMLNTHTDLVRRVNGRVPVMELKNMYMAWARTNGYKNTAPDDEELARQLKSAGLIVRAHLGSDAVEFRGRRIGGLIVHGLAFRDGADGEGMGGGGGGGGGSGGSISGAGSVSGAAFLGGSTITDASISSNSSDSQLRCPPGGVAGGGGGARASAPPPSAAAAPPAANIAASSTSPGARSVTSRASTSRASTSRGTRSATSRSSAPQGAHAGPPQGAHAGPSTAPVADIPPSSEIPPSSDTTSLTSIEMFMAEEEARKKAAAGQQSCEAAAGQQSCEAAGGEGQQRCESADTPAAATGSLFRRNASSSQSSARSSGGEAGGEAGAVAEGQRSCDTPGAGSSSRTGGSGSSKKSSRSSRTGGSSSRSGSGSGSSKRSSSGRKH